VSVNHYENFPVASVLCPPRLRPAIAAIYHYARTADDIADEGQATPVQRLQDLRQYRETLAQLFGGISPTGRWEAVFAALGQAVRRHNLPFKPLDDLLDAFMQDAQNPHYRDRADLLDYCSRSANPVGRLLLHLYRIDDSESLRQSDAICSALQLINFWQDLSVDLPRGRLYLPTEDLLAHGLAITDSLAQQDTAATRQLVKSLCLWAEELMHSGAPLALRIPGRAGWELRLVVQGGLRILNKIQRMQWATVQQRPVLRALDVPVLVWGALGMRSGRRLAASGVAT
jgi:squalene synthase HpnC